MYCAIYKRGDTEQQVSDGKEVLVLFVVDLPKECGGPWRVRGAVSTICGEHSHLMKVKQEAILVPF